MARAANDPRMLKGDGRGEVHELARGSWGVSWMAHPGETMRRASHALRDEGVWVVEPVDADGLDALLADLGEVRGVVVLADYHRRDAAAVAERHGVPVSVPSWLSVPVDGGEVRSLDPGERLADTDFEVRHVTDGGWSEAALWDGETLVAQEALVTADHLTAPGERLAVTPFLRLSPPGAFRDPAPERVLTGHGGPRLDGAADALDAALAGARRRAPSYFLHNGATLARSVWVAVRD